FDLNEFDSEISDTSTTASEDNFAGFGSDAENSDMEDNFSPDDMDFGFDTEGNDTMVQDVEAAFSDEGGSSFEASLDDDFDFMADGDEVSTKLDLARAYMDMGDMEGATSILQEVIEEGNDKQKQEASNLLQAGIN
ncbi:MAG: FimV/HubP family polar landmark protein, partial [Endozoicomonas sp.]